MKSFLTLNNQTCKEEYYLLYKTSMQSRLKEHRNIDNVNIAYDNNFHATNDHEYAKSNVHESAVYNWNMCK